MTRPDPEELLGESVDEEVVPMWPGRMYVDTWTSNTKRFATDLPAAPVVTAEVRFREANHSEDGDFTIYEARKVDLSDPKNTYGEWKNTYEE
jgi:hypothetical protein